MKRIELYDTTLRDGAGTEGISFSCIDKLSIFNLLADFGVDFVEGGFPASNPKDAEFFAAAAQQSDFSKLVAFSTIKAKSVSVEDDASLRGVLSASTKIAALVGKSSKRQVLDILGVSQEDNLDNIESSVRYLVSKGVRVFFDAEHYFDGYTEDPSYAIAVLRRAHEAGADRLILCDTNGGTFPESFAKICKETSVALPDAVLGVHCHNDNGFALANSLIAVQNGVTQIQGSFIGLGERCGNTNLCAVIGALPHYGLQIDANMADMTRVATAIVEICNISLPKNTPYVGKSAFTHKAGLHADAILKCPSAFEHIPPESVGNNRRFLLSEISGRASVAEKLSAYFPQITKYSKETERILQAVKDLEKQGYQYEGAEASFILLAEKIAGNFTPAFELISAETSTEVGDSAFASVAIRIGDKVCTAEACGNGPVNALDIALRKALENNFPQVIKLYLKDYKVRVINPEEATGARVRVLITSSDGENSWTTIGVSTDVIQASWEALTDSIDYLAYRGKAL